QNKTKNSILDIYPNGLQWYLVTVKVCDDLLDLVQGIISPTALVVPHSPIGDEKRTTDQGRVLPNDVLRSRSRKEVKLEQAANAPGGQYLSAIGQLDVRAVRAQAQHTVSSTRSWEYPHVERVTPVQVGFGFAMTISS